jgi:hypothetical protein
MHPLLLTAGLGVALGWLEKKVPNLPQVPVLGRHGTLAAAAYYLAPTVPFAAAAAPGLLLLSAYELAKQGSINGRRVSSDTWDSYEPAF